MRTSAVSGPWPAVGTLVFLLIVSCVLLAGVLAQPLAIAFARTVTLAPEHAAPVTRTATLMLGGVSVSVERTRQLDDLPAWWCLATQLEFAPAGRGGL